jgi:cell division ATPase FtsA
MRNFFKKVFTRKIKENKKENYLVIDIGSRGVRGLILEKGDKGNIIKKFSSEIFRKFSTFQTNNFENDIFKKAFSKVLIDLGLENDSLPETTLIGFNPEILKSEITNFAIKKNNYQRMTGEDENMIESILEKVQRKTIKNFIKQNNQLLINDFQIITKNIIEKKVSGYKVSSVKSRSGKTFSFKVLVIFTLKKYLKIISFVKSFFNSKNILLVNKAQGIFFWLKKRKKFSGIFIDIGSKFTQVFLLNNGLVEHILDIKIGGDIFTKTLSEKLGLTDQEAENLKIQFSKGEVSSDSEKIIQEFLSKPLSLWFDNLKQKLKKCCNDFDIFLPKNFYIFGGGSLLPGIKKILKNGDWEDLPILSTNKSIKFILPNDLPLKDKSGLLNSAKETGIIFLALSI